MAIKSYLDENGKRFFLVSVNVRSKLSPSIRKQKKRKGIPTKVKAERIEKQLYEKAFQEVAAIDGQGYQWGQIVEKWYVYKQTDKFEPIGEHTLADYYSALRAWTRKFWEKPAKHLTRADIKHVIKDLDDSGRSKSFQAKMKGTINRVYSWGIEEGLIKEVFQSPTWGVTVNRKSERTPTILNREEISRLLQAAKTLDSPWYPI